MSFSHENFLRRVSNRLLEEYFKHRNICSNVDFQEIKKETDIQSMGSGRSWYGYRKKTTEDYHAIDVRYWYRQGLLIPKTSFTYRWFCNERNTGSICVCAKTDRVVLSYRYPVAGGNWQEKEYPVLLDWTPNHFGGKRPWFLCPAQGCGRRVAILYGGTVFACRHCYRLAYPSQRETKYNRAERQANKIREKLGWESGVLTPIGSKPKGMHWETFSRLFMKQNELEDFVIKGWFDSIRNN